MKVKPKAIPARGRKRKPKPGPDAIGWLSEMMKGLADEAEGSDDASREANKGDIGDDENRKASTDLERKSSASRPSARKPEQEQAKLAKAAEILVQEAFGPAENPSDQDAVEMGEEEYKEEMSRLSGLDDMETREQDMLQKACSQLSRADSSSPLLESNIQRAIARQVAAGLPPEEAAEEVMLNHEGLLGNFSAEQLESQVVLVEGQSQLAEAEAAQLAAEASASAKSVTGENSISNLSVPFHRWFEECLLSGKALQERSKAIESRTVGENGELSLAFGNIAGTAPPAQKGLEENSGNAGDDQPVNTVFFVHWKFPGDRGRPASLDADDRVKCIVPTGSLRELRNYSTLKILHPAVGAKMERIRGWKGALRPQVKKEVVRLRDMCQSALVVQDLKALEREDQGNSGGELSNYSASASTAAAETEKCFVCEKSSFLLEGAKSVKVEACPFCLLVAHETCRQQLAKHAEQLDFSFPEDLEPASLDLPGDVFDSEFQNLVSQVKGWKDSVHTSPQHLQHFFLERALS